MPQHTHFIQSVLFCSVYRIPYNSTDKKFKQSELIVITFTVH
jgi:hypothetical protein